MKNLHLHNFLRGNLKSEHFLITEKGQVSLISCKPTNITLSSSDLDIGKNKGKATEKDVLAASGIAMRMYYEEALAKNLIEAD